MPDLVEFLQARLAEEELLAQAAAAFITGSHWRSHKDVVETAEDVDADYLARSVAVSGNWTVPEHIARHDPARVLADIEAKRRIIEQYERAYANRQAHPDDLASAGALLALHGVVGSLALPFADHPDYDPGWKP